MKSKMIQFSGSVLPALVASSVIVVSALLAGCGGGQPTVQRSVMPLIIMTPSLPNTIVASPYSQTIEASGGVAPFSWTISAGALPDNLSLANSTTNSVTIVGTPDVVVQGVAFTVKVSDSASHSATQSYTISILPQPDTLSLSSASLNFPPQLIGSTSVKQTETLTNTGSAVLNISNINITGENVADFNANNTNCSSTLDIGSSCTINVTFKPAQLGPRSASIEISDDTGGSPQSVSLTGVALVPGPNAALSATNLNFAAQPVNTESSAQSIVVTNYGASTLAVSGIVASSNFAESDNCTPNLVSAANCTIAVNFAPGAAGFLTGTVSLTDNAPNSPQTIQLAGIGGNSTTATLTPSSMTLSCRAALVFSGCSPPQNATLTNTGSSTLFLQSINVDGKYFSQTSACPTSLAPKESCEITVSFDGPASRTHPQKETFIGALIVVDSAVSSPQRVSLTGVTSGVP